MAHNRHPLLLKYGRIGPALIGGFSLEWWSPKHNMHHIFTNSQLYDEDIKHNYKVYLYEFLYLKWRFDSLVSAIVKLNYVKYKLINRSNSLVFQSTMLFLVTSMKTSYGSSLVVLLLDFTQLMF
jgi:fatty acid desaturase